MTATTLYDLIEKGLLIGRDIVCVSRTVAFRGPIDRIKIDQETGFVTFIPRWMAVRPDTLQLQADWRLTKPFCLGKLLDLDTEIHGLDQPIKFYLQGCTARILPANDNLPYPLPSTYRSSEQ